MALRRACTLFALILVACTGADETELFEEPVTGSGTTLPPPSDPGTTKPPTTPTPSNPTNPDPPKKEDEKPTCATEVEPNNNRGSATPFTSCVSGKLSSGSDVDNLTVKAPANAKAMTVKSTGTGGRIQYTLTGGGFFGINEQWTADEDAPEIRVTPDESYTITVRSGGGGGERTWKVEVAFE